MNDYEEQVIALKAYIKIIEKEPQYDGKKEELDFQKERLKKLIELTGKK